MASASQVPISVPSKEDPEFQAKVDAALLQAVNIADIAKTLELIQLGANPTSAQKKGRTGTTNALIVAVQNISDDGSSDKAVSALLASEQVRLAFCAYVSLS